MLMAPALLFGAAEATAKLLTKKEESNGSWVSDFQAQFSKVLSSSLCVDFDRVNIRVYIVQRERDKANI